MAKSENTLPFSFGLAKCLTQNFIHHPKVTVYDSWPFDFENYVPKQLRNLPVNLLKEDNLISDKLNNNQRESSLPPNENLDKNSKPLRIRELCFDKWSEAIEYVSSHISNTLNKLLKLKEIVDEEIILKIFDLEKCINDFRIVAKIYEDSNNKTFSNGYLEKQFIKFYEGTEELRKYNKRYKDPRNNYD